MKQWKKNTLLAAVALFIGLNVFLLLQEDQEMDRLQIIDRFISPMQIDIIESIDKPGIISSTGEEHVYYNENLGSLGTVYIEEGQEVQFGEALFSYDNIQLGAAERELELKIEQNELKADQLSDEISTLTNLKNTLTRTQTNADQEETLLLESQLAQYEVQIQQKEHQRESLELEREIYQQSLLTLGEQQGQLEITSPVTGVVKEINTNRNQPFITLLPSPFVAIGELTEEESLEIVEGLNVEIWMHDHEPMDGVLTKISNFPTTDPTIGQETNYPFHVEFSDLETELKIGYHVDLKLIQHKIPNAIVIPSRSFVAKEEESVVFIPEEGYIREKEIVLGMPAQANHEVLSGLTTMDLLMADPLTVTPDQPFVMKVKLSDLEKEAVSSFRKKELLLLTLQGFFK